MISSRFLGFLTGNIAKSGHQKSFASRAGDSARGRAEWQEAAAHYRRHLLLAPADVAIWIQLGHALKEAGETDAAGHAYGEAYRITPDDPDLLLNLGHLHRLAGNTDAAVDYLRRSVELDGNPHALAELERLGVPAQEPRGNLTAQQRERVLDFMLSRSAGLTPVASSDVLVEAGDRLRFLSQDPWIEFLFTDDADRSGPIGLLEIEAQSSSGDEVSGQIYVDHGFGFDEHISAKFPMQNGTAPVILIDPASIKRIRWDPDRANSTIASPRLSYRPITDVAVLKGLVNTFAPHDAAIDRLIAPLADLLASGDTAALPTRLPRLISFQVDFSHDYDFWLLQNDTLSENDRREIERMTQTFHTKPKFSFVMPTYNTPETLLRECLDAMLGQTYADFEICVADDNSPDATVTAVLEEYAQADARVRYVRRARNGHISAASNSALALATGDFVVLVDHDDLIPEYALFVAAWYINKYPNGDIFYSDEDKVTPKGQRLHPYFKSDFNKFLMYGHNMISHLGIYRRSLVEQVGGFRLGLEGSQDYDLFLRCMETCGEQGVVHIPHVLYHWRIIPGSTAMSADQKSYAVIAAGEAINGHFERTGLPFRSREGFAPGCTSVRPTHTYSTPVSIIIPTRNGVEVLEPCVESILNRDTTAVEIIIVDNGSDERETLDYLAKLESGGVAKVIRYPGEFNFSSINNLAARQARGEILCFLNNDTEVLSGDWMNRARAFLDLPEVGVVGARLLYPDGHLQHFGLVLGMGEHRVAGTPHGGMPGDEAGYFGKARLLQEVSAVTAACLFIRKTDFDAVGGFEPELRVAYNDVDLCLKIRKSGLKILVDPDISLIHKESKTRGSDKRGERFKRLSQEADWMQDKWGGILGSDPYYSPNLDIERIDFALAPQPRTAWPWHDGSRAESTARTDLPASAN